MRIKVAMLADFPEIGKPIEGGVQAVTKYLVDALVETGDAEVSIITFRTGIHSPSLEKTDSYTHISVPFGRLGTLSGLRQDQATLNRCLKDICPDVVHSQGSGHHGILAARSGLASVVTIHGILLKEARYLATYKRRMRIRLQGLLSEYYCIRRAQHTIIISPYVADHYGSRLTGQKYLIPNPVDSRFFEVTRSEEPARILFLGRLVALKGVKDLVSSVSQLPGIPNIRLILAGPDSDESYVESLRDHIRSLDMQDIVSLPGNLDFPGILSELSRCACLVLPSYQETAPMVIQEAMAAGVPVLASNICGIPYQIRHSETGYLFQPGDTEALTKYLATILSDSAIRHELGRASKRYAEKEFRANVVAHRTLRVYDKLLRRS